MARYVETVRQRRKGKRKSYETFSLYFRYHKKYYILVVVRVLLYEVVQREHGEVVFVLLGWRRVPELALGLSVVLSDVRVPLPDVLNRSSRRVSTVSTFWRRGARRRRRPAGHYIRRTRRSS